MCPNIIFNIEKHLILLRLTGVNRVTPEAPTARFDVGQALPMFDILHYNFLNVNTLF